MTGYRIGYVIGEILARPTAWILFQVAKHHRPTRLMLLRWADEKRKGK